jgi:predicted ABC-type ATPase
LERDLRGAVSKVVSETGKKQSSPEAKGHGQRPVRVVVAGPNGSGKTSFVSKLLLQGWLAGCVHINADEIAQKEFGDWNSPQAVLRAAQRADGMREDCLRQKKNFIWETVFSSGGKVDFLWGGEMEGYFIRLVFIATTSPSLNAARVALRVMKGGHDVPITKIVSRYLKSIANCAAGILLADRAHIYDNSRENSDPALLFRTRDGQVVEKYGPLPNWAEVIESNLQSGLGPGR